jgi:mono/diheme cytochrome c family protein
MNVSKTNVGTKFLTCILLSLFFAGCLGNDDKKDSAVPAPLYAKGKARFEGICTGCHGVDAKGSGPNPPLYHSDFLMADRHRPIRIQFLGLPNKVDTATTIVVSDSVFSGMQMPDIGFCSSDSEIAGVLSYVRVTFNTATDFITVQEVASVRDSLIQAKILDTTGYAARCAM